MVITLTELKAFAKQSHKQSQAVDRSSRKPSFATCMSMACCKASKAYRQSIGLPTAKLICKLATTAYNEALNKSSTAYFRSSN